LLLAVWENAELTINTPTNKLNQIFISTGLLF
jgi:hypothetical protein